jgi:hypothetical protein
MQAQRRRKAAAADGSYQVLTLDGIREVQCLIAGRHGYVRRGRT